MRGEALEFERLSEEFWSKVKKKYPELLTEHMELNSGSDLIRVFA